MESLDLTVTIDRPMPDAQTQLLSDLDSRLRSVGFTGHPHDNGVNYRPKFIGPVFVWLARRLSGEHVMFAFEQHGQVTEVRVTEARVAHRRPSRPTPAVSAAWSQGAGFPDHR
jgi:hypothetical protein